MRGEHISSRPWSRDATLPALRAQPASSRPRSLLFVFTCHIARHLHQSHIGIRALISGGISLRASSLEDDGRAELAMVRGEPYNSLRESQVAAVPDRLREHIVM